jgi:hypothetical protein
MPVRPLRGFEDCVPVVVVVVVGVVVGVGVGGAAVVAWGI